MSKVSLRLAREASQKPVSPPPIVLRSAEAARALGISPRTLWSLTKAGLIPHIRMGRCLSYPTAAIYQWIEENTINPIVRRQDDAARGDDGKEVSA